MKKRKIFLSLSVALCLALTACTPTGEGPAPSPSPTAPPPEVSVPVLATPSPEPSAPALADYDLPQRDYQPWQVGYMEFLNGLAWADWDSREKLTEAGEYYWPAYEGLAVDRRGVFCMDAGEQLRMTLTMALGSESYSLYDVDQDGVPELFVKYGSFEAAFTYQCYTFRDGQVVCIGEFDGGHSGLYTHPDKSAVLRSEGHMGYKEVYEYPVEGGVLTEEREIFSEEDVWEYTPTEEIVPGAAYIDYYYTQLGEYDTYQGYAPESEWRGYDDGQPHPSAGKALLLPIADYYDGPAATGSDSEQARAAILAALNGETELYGASGDHFYGDVGWTAWAEYVQPGAAYPWNEEPLEIKAHAWLDMNGDGQEECVLQLSEPERADDAVTRSRYTVVLSHQDGTVYAYFFGIYDLELCEDGAFQIDYGGPVRLSFWKDQCYDYAVPDTSAPAVKWVEVAPAG